MQVMVGLEPRLRHVSLSTFTQSAGSKTMVTAMLFYGLTALMVPVYLARMLTYSAETASQDSVEVALAAPMVVLLVLLVIEALRRKISPVKQRQMFVSCARRPSQTYCGLGLAVDHVRAASRSIFVPRVKYC
jgi:hypothetical protein